MSVYFKRNIPKRAFGAVWLKSTVIVENDPDPALKPELTQCKRNANLNPAQPGRNMFLAGLREKQKRKFATASPDSIRHSFGKKQPLAYPHRILVQVVDEMG